MTSTICGHERAELVTWLRAANAFTAITPATNCACSACAARNAALDPAKLAELMAEALRERRITTTAADANLTHVTSEATVVLWFGKNGIHWHHIDNRDGALDMHHARAALLRILELPNGATAEDATKALLDNG